MAEVASAYVSLLPSARGFGAKMTSQVGGEVDKAGKTLGSRLGNAMKIGLAVGGVALAAFGKSVVDASSNAQQSVGATETVFGKFADAVIKTSSKAANAYGLSANEYRENANLIGSLFKNQGVEMDKLGASTEKMIARSADLAATFGGSTKEAVEALGAAFKGEFNQVERYGISLRQSTINMEAFRIAGVSTESEFNALSVASQNAAKRQATTNLIFAQSKDSMGAFGREANTLAGQQQRLSAQFDNFKVLLGTALLPLLTRFVAFLTTTVIPGLTGFVNGMRDGTGAGGTFAAILTTVGSTLVSVASFVNQHRTAFVALGATIAVVTVIVQAHAAALAVAAAGGLLKYLAATKLVTTATKVWAAVQWVLNGALLANPVGAVIIAIAALVAGVIIAYKKSETFRNIVQQLWATLKTWASILSGVVAGAIKVVIAFVGDLTGRVVAMGKAIRERVQDVVEFVKGLKDKFGDAVNFVESIPGKITDALGDLGNLLYNAGIKVLAGFVEGIRSKIDDLRGVLSGITDKIPDWKGPADKDAVLLRPAGQMIMKGLVDGIEDGTAALREKLQGITDEIKSRIDSIKSDMASLAGSVASAFTGNLFEATDTQGFLGNLLDTKGQLKELKRAFKRLVKWGLSPQFLSQLFASGNGALILDLASSGNRGFALEAAQAFGQVNNLANSLGGAVARNQYGKQLDRANSHLAEIRRDIKNLPKNIGREINGAATSGQHGRVA